MLFTVSCTTTTVTDVNPSRTPSSQPQELMQLVRTVQTSKTRLLYLADSNHNNPTIKSSFAQLIKLAALEDQGIRCLFVEADHNLYQPYIDRYETKRGSWQNTVKRADQEWKQLTGRPYTQNKEVYDMAIDLGLKIYAVDWDDSAKESFEMKELFAKGRKDPESLAKAFQIGVTRRNEEISKNIRKRLPVCGKAIFTVGDLHLKTHADMSSIGIGVQQFKSISSFLSLAKDEQKIVGTYDCKNLLNAEPQIEEICKQIKDDENAKKEDPSQTNAIGYSLPFPEDSDPISSGFILLR